MTDPKETTLGAPFAPSLPTITEHIFTVGDMHLAWWWGAAWGAIGGLLIGYMAWKVTA